MARIEPEFITRFGDVQSSIWEIAAQSVGTSFNAEIELANPLTISAKPDDLLAELGGAQLIIRWEFAQLPEHEHLIVLSQELALQLIGLVEDPRPESMEPDVLFPHNERFASFVQGIIEGCASFKSLTIQPDSLQIQYEVFSLPNDLQLRDELVRVQVALGGGDVSGGVTWILDEESARGLLGEQMPVDSGVEEHAAAPKIVSKEERDIEMLMDIPLEVTVELGQVSMLIQDILELGSGSIVELEKAAGEPVDVLVNGRLVARGEVVVVEDNFGVRLTEILSLQDRVGKLGEAA